MDFKHILNIINELLDTKSKKIKMDTWRKIELHLKANMNYLDFGSISTLKYDFYLQLKVCL